MSETVYERVAVANEEYRKPAERPIYSSICLFEDELRPKEELEKAVELEKPAAALEGAFNVMLVRQVSLALELARLGVCHFVLDISVHPEQNDKTGLNLLEALRTWYGSRVCIVVWSAQADKYRREMERLKPGPDLIVQKEKNNLAAEAVEIATKLVTWDRKKSWPAPQAGEGLLPSDALALRIASADDAKLKAVVEERRQFQVAAGVGPPPFDVKQLVAEIGDSMRDEVATLLAAMVASGSESRFLILDHASPAQGFRHALLEVLPFGEDIDDCLARFWQELHAAAQARTRLGDAQLEWEEGRVWLVRAPAPD